MRLIPKQFENIKKEVEHLELKSADNKEYLDARHSMSRDDGFGFAVYDEVSDRDVYGRIRKLRELKNLLQNAIIIENPNSDIIELGSEFKLEGRNYIYTLVETTSGLNLGSDMKYVTLNSPFGRAVLGKEAGDSIEYTVKGRNKKITKKISEIIKKDRYGFEQDEGPVLKK